MNSVSKRFRIAILKKMGKNYERVQIHSSTLKFSVLGYHVTGVLLAWDSHLSISFVRGILLFGERNM